MLFNTPKYSRGWGRGGGWGACSQLEQLLHHLPPEGLVGRCAAWVGSRLGSLWSRSLFTTEMSMKWWRNVTSLFRCNSRSAHRTSPRPLRVGCNPRCCPEPVWICSSSPSFPHLSPHCLSAAGLMHSGAHCYSSLVHPLHKQEFAFPDQTYGPLSLFGQVLLSGSRGANSSRWSYNSPYDVWTDRRASIRHRGSGRRSLQINCDHGLWYIQSICNVCQTNTKYPNSNNHTARHHHRLTLLLVAATTTSFNKLN